MTKWLDFSFGLRRRLFVFGAIAAIPGLVLVLHADRDLRRLSLANAEESALSVVRQLAHEQARTLDRVRAQVGLLAEVDVVRDAPAEDCGAFMAEFQARNYPLFASLGRVDASGQIRCSADPQGVGLAVGELPIVRRAMAARPSEVVVGDYLMSPVARRPVVTVATPLYGAGEEPVGMVWGSVDLKWATQVFADANLPDGVRVSLVDRAGALLARFPDEAAAVGATVPEAVALREAVAGRREGVTRLPDRAGTIYAFAKIPAEPGPDLLFYASVAAEKVYASADEQLRRNLLALLAAVAVVIGGGLVAGRQLVLRPMGRLQAAARRLAGGDLSARARLGGGRDELAELGRTFDHMAEAIEAREATVRRLNRVYAVLSSINGLIIRAGHREGLLDEACRIAIEQGGYRLAWIALLDEGGQRIESVTAAGETDSARARLVPPVGLAAAEREGLAETLVAGRTVICPAPEDIPRAGAGEPSPAYAVCAMLPLTSDGRLAGCIALYADEPGAFDAAEMRLLGEVAADISHALAHIDQSERLRFLVSSDLLTGLPNSENFCQRLALALRILQDQHSTQLAVLMVGLHGVRNINSVHGLHVGDRVLGESAKRLQAVMPPDAILGRMRSGVFGVVLPRPEERGGTVFFAEQILGCFAKPFVIDELTLYVGIRIGITQAPMDGTDAQRLVQHAQTALASLKGEIGVFSFYISELQQRAERQLRLEHGLRAALARHDELYLLYQPVVSVTTRQMVGVEALLRWRHPQLGELPPSQFVPVAEAAGLMVPLGEWILRTAWHQARAWSDQGVDGVKVAVNVSASQLRHSGFLATVEAAIAASGADPHALALGVEITESELMEDAEATVELLTRLKERGFSLSMDDFGTGYSSLAYLRRFPLDVLKIDIAFIREVSRDGTSASIVRAIVALAEALGLQTVAEGVETVEQFDCLTRCGCSSVQGFLFGCAMPAERIAGMAGRPLSPEEPSVGQGAAR